MTDAPTEPDRPVAATPAPEDPALAPVLGCDGVAAVRGVRTDDDRLRVEVVARFGTSLTALGDRVGDALDGVLAGRKLHLDVVDVVA